MTMLQLDVSPYLNSALPDMGQPLQIKDDSVMIEANDNMPIQIFLDMKVGPILLDPWLLFEDGQARIRDPFATLDEGGAQNRRKSF